MSLDIFQEKGVRYLIHDVHCDENGDFQQAQCAVMLNSGREGCFCIDRENWMSHVPGPMAHTREELDCSMINSGRGPYQGVKSFLREYSPTMTNYINQLLYWYIEQ